MTGVDADVDVEASAAAPPSTVCRRTASGCRFVALTTTMSPWTMRPGFSILETS